VNVHGNDFDWNLLDYTPDVLGKSMAQVDMELDNTDVH